MKCWGKLPFRVIQAYSLPIVVYSECQGYSGQNTTTFIGDQPRHASRFVNAQSDQSEPNELCPCGQLEVSSAQLARPVSASEKWLPTFSSDPSSSTFIHL